MRSLQDDDIHRDQPTKGTWVEKGKTPPFLSFYCGAPNPRSDSNGLARPCSHLAQRDIAIAHCSGGCSSGGSFERVPRQSRCQEWAA